MQKTNRKHLLNQVYKSSKNREWLKNSINVYREKLQTYIDKFNYVRKESEKCCMPEDREKLEKAWKAFYAALVNAEITDQDVDKAHQAHVKKYGEPSPVARQINKRLEYDDIESI